MMKPIAVLTWLLALSMPARGGVVDLHLSNPSGAPLEAVPVTVGVPFAVDQLNDETAVSLQNPGEVAVPCQTTVTSRWWARGGSIQTLLVTFIANTADSTYTLQYGADALEGPLPAHPVSAQKIGEVVHVDTGVLRATLGGEGSGFIRSLAYDADGDGTYGDAETVIDASRPGTLSCGKYSSEFGVPEDIEIEEAGPVRAVVRITGHHRAREGRRSLAYDVRLRFHAGLPTIDVDHTFVQDTDQVFAPFGPVSMDLPLVMQDGDVSFGLEGTQAVRRHAAPDGQVELLQLGPDQREGIAGKDREEFARLLQERQAYWSEDERARWTREPQRTQWQATVAQNGQQTAVGDKATGRVQIVPAGRPWALTAAMRDFWQLHPKSLALHSGVLRLGLCPDSADRPLKLHVGTAKTHSSLLVLHRLDGAQQAADIARAFDRPVYYFPSPEWMCQSGVWGSVFPRQEGRFTLYEAQAADVIENDFYRRVAGRNGYGMLNYGDIPWGNNYWQNLETAYAHGLTSQFIRTGDRRVFDAMQRAAWHLRDVDVQQADVPGKWDWALWIMPGYMPEKLARLCAEDDELREKLFYWTGTQPPGIGGVHRHSYMHFANAPSTPVPSDNQYEHKRLRLYSGSCDVGGHGWIVGLVDDYLLTGDRRSLEVAELAGEWVLQRGGTDWGRDNWKYIDLAWLYRATGKQKYLDRLMQAIDVIYADKNSTVERIAAQDKTLMSPFYTILQFIKHVHQMTGDPQVRRKFLDLVTAWIDHVPTTDSHMGPVFQYIRDYRDSRCHTDFADLAYAYLLTGDRKYLDKSLNTFDFYLHFAYHSTALFSVPEYLYALDKVGIDALTDPVPQIRTGLAFWQDETDEPVSLVAYQQSGYRVPATETTGAISITSPSGRQTTTPIDRSGLDVYRFTVPPDDETGTYKIEARAEGCYFWLGASAPLLSGPPPVLVEGRFGNGIKLVDGAKLDIPAEGNIALDEGTVEMWLKPFWSAPSGRKQAVPYHYHQLFDSRDTGYDYGLNIYLYDGGETTSSKTLIGLWSDKDKAEHVSREVRWEQGQWHHIAFAWRRTGPGVGSMRLYIDGELVGSKDNAGSFPSRLSPTIRLGKNATDSPNTSLDGVLDELRVSRIMREPDMSGPLTADADTLLLERFERVPAP